jgi:hypothetical protein
MPRQEEKVVIQWASPGADESRAMNASDGWDTYLSSASTWLRPLLPATSTVRKVEAKVAELIRMWSKSRGINRPCHFSSYGSSLKWTASRKLLLRIEEAAYAWVV